MNRSLCYSKILHTAQMFTARHTRLQNAVQLFPNPPFGFICVFFFFFFFSVFHFLFIFQMQWLNIAKCQFIFHSCMIFSFRFLISWVNNGENANGRKLNEPTTSNTISFWFYFLKFDTSIMMQGVHCSVYRKIFSIAEGPCLELQPTISVHPVWNMASREN